MGIKIPQNERKDGMRPLYLFAPLLAAALCTGCAAKPPVTEGRIIDLYTRVQEVNGEITRSYFVKIREEGGWNRTNTVQVSEKLFLQLAEDDRFVVPVSAEQPATDNATPAEQK